MYEIFKLMLKSDGYLISSNIKKAFLEYITEEKKKDNFANARTVRNIVDKIKIEQSSRVAENPNEDVNYIKKIDFKTVIKNQQVEKVKLKIGFCKENC